MNSQARGIRIQLGRILSLEPLETRNLSASMPWAHSLPMDQHHEGPDILAHGRGHMAEMGQTRQSGAQVRSFALEQAPRAGFRPPAPHEHGRLTTAARDAQVQAQSAPPRDSQQLSLAPPSNQLGSSVADARPRPPAENDTNSRPPNLSLANADSLARSMPVAEATLSLVFVVARLGPGNVAENARTIGASASPRDSSNSAVPAQTGAALARFDARLDAPLTSLPSRPGAAAPMLPNDDAVTFNFANPGISASSPLDGPAFARDEFEPFWVPSQTWPPTHNASQLEQVMQELFLDSAHADSQRGLDELLDTLLEDNKRANQQDAEKDNPSSILEPASQPSSSQAEISKVEQSSLQGGMIAMGLPQDQWFSPALLNQGLPIDMELVRDQSRAWTASVELYRSHELALATKSAEPGNDSPQVSKEKSGSLATRLRPLLGLSSVAIGAIFIGLRRYRQNAQRREQAGQKLV